MIRKISMGKRVVACICSVAMAGALVPAVAMAADSGSVVADETVLTIKAQKVDESGNNIGSEQTITYTASDLQEKVVQGQTYNYLYSGKGKVTKVESSSVVSFSSLMNDVSSYYTDAKIAVKSSDGATGKYTFTYSDITEDKYYFPKYENSSESKIDTTGAVEVPAGLALSAKKGTIESGQVASDVTATEEVTGVPMSVNGCAKDSGELAWGNNFWTSINELDITYTAPALTIWTVDLSQSGPEVTATYTQSQLAALAKANTTTASYQYSGKGGISKIETSNYVTFKQLFGSLGSKMWNKDSYFTVSAGGDMNMKHDYYYGDVATTGYYFPNAESGASSLDTSDAVAVPAGLALSYKKGTVATGATAKDTECTKSVEGTLVVSGAAKAATEMLPGSVFWTNVDTIYLCYKGINTMKVSPTTKTFKVAKVKKAKNTFKIKATKAQGKVTYSVTKSAKKAGVSVAKNGKVTIKKGTKKGTYKVTVTAAGNDNYRSISKTVKVKIK